MTIFRDIDNDIESLPTWARWLIPLVFMAACFAGAIMGTIHALSSKG